MFAPLANLPKSQAYARKLAEAHGEAYAVTIITAAIHQMNTPALPEEAGFNKRYRAQVQEMHDAIVRAEGMKAVAIALAVHDGLLHYTAEREIDQQISTLAQTIYIDRLDLVRRNQEQST